MPELAEPYKSSPKRAKNYFIFNSTFLVNTITFITNNHALNMSGLYQNERGQGMSHATGPSKVPESIARQVPKGLEKSLPNSVCQTSPVRHVQF